MSETIATVPASMQVADAVEALREQRLSALAVADVRGKLIGVVSQRDLMGRGRRKHVSDVMTPLIFSIAHDASVADAARVMVDSHLRRLFVQRDGELVGLISLTDVARLVAERGVGETPRPANQNVPLWQLVEVDKPREAFLASLDRCGDELPRHFYKALLSRSPRIAAFFRNVDMQRQQRRLATILRVAADAVAGKPEALAAIREQAERHGERGLGVPVDLYAEWLDALIEAAAHCDPAFNSAVEHAWRALLGHVIRQMTARS